MVGLIEIRRRQRPAWWLRHFSSLLIVRALKKDKKDSVEKETPKEKRVIDDTNRHKPFGKTAWAPVDDVYVLRFYPRTVYDAAEAVGMLKKFQALDFTPYNQPVYIDLKLDMKLEKKVIITKTLVLNELHFRTQDVESSL